MKFLNPKQAEHITSDKVEISECPICKAFCNNMYYMQDGKSKIKSKWYHCACGVIFQKDKPSGIYNEKYIKDFIDGGEKVKVSFEYPLRIYLPLIEDMIYGRKALVVGTPVPYQTYLLRKNGWVTYSIDKNKDIPPSDRHIVGDFETHDFGLMINKGNGLERVEDSFNLIWMYSTIECFLNPIESIKKCFTLLPEDGILFIVTPDTDFVHTRSTASYVNWKPEYNNIMWNKRSLVFQLEKLGFNVIMARRNYEHRFPSVDDIHIIAQKKFF